MARILILGAGFAGLWAALAAARKRSEAGQRGADVEILVIDRNPYHNIRVRNYEVDISEAAIPLAKVLDPVAVKHVAAKVESIDTTKQQVAISTARGSEKSRLRSARAGARQPIGTAGDSGSRRTRI